MYGKKTKKRTQDPAPSHVPMDPWQDGQDRLSSLSQRRSVGYPAPDMTGVVWSQAQKAQRQNFAKASAYAKLAIKDPEIRQFYVEMAKKRKRTSGGPAIWQSRTIFKAMTCSGRSSMAIERNRRTGAGTPKARSCHRHRSQGHDGEIAKRDVMSCFDICHFHSRSNFFSMQRPICFPSSSSKARTDRPEDSLIVTQ